MVANLMYRYNIPIYDEDKLHCMVCILPDIAVCFCPNKKYKQKIEAAINIENNGPYFIYT